MLEPTQLRLPRRWTVALLVTGLAVLLAQLGHLLAYGWQVPATGSHSYYPAAIHLVGGSLAALLLVSLTVIALARLQYRGIAHGPGWSLPLLFSTLLLLQVSVFVVQETLEAGALPGSRALAAGLLAQQPVALAAALVMRWLSRRLGPALAALGTATPFRAPQPLPGWLLAAETQVVGLPGCRPAASFSRGPPV
ncbi:MAG: hypothetical protein ACR2MZ_14735 [Candidatus Dormibacter sp.]|uniref:hypothetical protein n=1 Tax=Candidatus Dormibacter sp. TaxID=2973982 RepID=UPI003D9ACA52